MALLVAYSLWGEAAAVRAPVSTGYIDMDFVDVKITHPATVPVGAGPTVVELNYMKITVDVGGSAPGNDGPPVLYIDVKNMYPGAKVTVNGYLRNDGTIPVRVEKCNFRSIGGAFAFKDVDLDFDIQVDVDAFKGGNAPPFTLMPGQSAYVVVYIRARNDARESVSVSAQFTCDYRQAP
ncbi:hypothetical protein [Pyrobaculum neutrophilum]|nr:hypothetical protein [Pyrobaculum neutrophilum]